MRALVAMTAGAAVAAGLGAALAGDAGRGTTVTIYRQTTRLPPGSQGGQSYGGAVQTVGGAVVVQRRAVELDEGESEVRFPGVAARLDGASVQFRSRTDPAGTEVLSQRFASEAGTPDAILARHVGRPVVVLTDRGEVRGTLRSHSGAQLVVETDDPDFPIRMIQRGSHVRDVRFGAGSGPIATEPTLSWRVRADRGGTHQVEISYRTEGLTWKADYTAVYDPEASTIDLTSWASLDNASGLDLDDARVVLVQRESTSPRPDAHGRPAPAPPVTTWSHSLSRSVDVDDGDRVQLELAPPLRDAPAREVILFEAMPDYSGYNTQYPQLDCYGYQYQPPQHSGNTGRYVEARPEGDVGDLPGGRLRMYRRGSDGALALIGEERFEPASSSGGVRVRVGSSDSIAGRRKQLSCQPNEKARELRERLEVTIENEGEERQRVVVREYMQRWTKWSIVKESTRGRPVGSSGREWRVDVPPGGTKKVTYTVLYTW